MKNVIIFNNIPNILLQRIQKYVDNENLFGVDLYCGMKEQAHESIGTKM